MSRARRDPGESIANEDHVHAHAVASHHVGGATFRSHCGGGVCLEPHPMAQYKSRQPLARGVRDNGRHLDAEQPDMTHVFEIDGFAADDSTHQQGFGLFERRSGCNDNGRSES
jgi:hypothetical protein